MRVNSLFELSAVATVTQGRYSIGADRAKLPLELQEICDKIYRCLIAKFSEFHPFPSVRLIVDGEYDSLTSKYYLIAYPISYYHSQPVLLRYQENKELLLEKLKKENPRLPIPDITIENFIEMLKPVMKEDNAQVFSEWLSIKFNAHLYDLSFFLSCLYAYQVSPNGKGTNFLPEKICQFLFEVTSERPELIVSDKDRSELNKLMVLMSLAEGNADIEHIMAEVELDQQIRAAIFLYDYAGDDMIKNFLNHHDLFFLQGTILWVFNQGKLSVWNKLISNIEEKGEKEEVYEILRKFIVICSSDKSLPILEQLKGQGFFRKLNANTLAAMLREAVENKQRQLLQFLIAHVQELHRNKYRTLPKPMRDGYHIIGKDDPDYTYTPFEIQQISRVLLLSAYRKALALGNLDVIECLRSTKMLSSSYYCYYEAWKYSAQHVQVDLIDYLVNVVLKNRLHKTEKGSRLSVKDKTEVLQEGMSAAFTISRNQIYKYLLLATCQRLKSEKGIHIEFF